MDATSPSKANMRRPSYWGPTFWKTYDIICETYPTAPTSEEKHAAKRFFYSQRYLLPCKTCRKNYVSIIEQYPPRVESRKALRSWMRMLKEQVNKHKQLAAAQKR